MSTESTAYSTAMPMGKKIERIRTYLGIKQESLAADLGISQQAVSNLERQEVLENSILSQVAEKLGVTVEMIRNFDEEKAIYNINNYNYTDATIEEGATAIVQQINPVEKIVELYERLLKSEREKIELLMNKK